MSETRGQISAGVIGVWKIVEFNALVDQMKSKVNGDNPLIKGFAEAMSASVSVGAGLYLLVCASVLLIALAIALRDRTGMSGESRPLLVSAACSPALVAVAVWIGFHQTQAERSDSTPAQSTSRRPSAAAMHADDEHADEPVQTTAPPAIVSVAALPAFSTDNVESFCREKWTKRGQLDNRMFQYCSTKQTNGFSSLKNLWTQADKLPWMHTLLPLVWGKWTEQGVTDYEMVAYGMNAELNGYKDYQYEQTTAKYDSARMQACQLKWQDNSSPWTMAVYCYKND